MDKLLDILYNIQYAASDSDSTVLYYYIAATNLLIY